MKIQGSSVQCYFSSGIHFVFLFSSQLIILVLIQF